jgi:hypothetical protein
MTARTRSILLGIAHTLAIVAAVVAFGLGWGVIGYAVCAGRLVVP